MSLLLLGQDHVSYGEPHYVQLGPVSASLCVGSDPNSPSLQFKADPEKPNEDGLLVAQQESLTLLAVADAHFGIEASHVLLSRIAEWDRVPCSLEDLEQAVLGIELPLVDSRSASTLSVAIFDSKSGQGFGLNVGDSSICTLKKDLKHLVEGNSDYLGWNAAWNQDLFTKCEFKLESGDVLLLFTDGVNECHYRSPQTSIRAAHIETLWQYYGSETSRFVEALTTLALDGVPGNPGGQDNIAIVALKVV